MAGVSGDIAAFLAARYDEAEALAKAAAPEWDAEWAVHEWNDLPDAAFAHARGLGPAHRLRDIALKRAILALHHPEWNDYIDGDGMDRTSLECAECEPPGTPDNWPCPTVRHLAAEFKDHPEYEEAWKP